MSEVSVRVGDAERRVVDDRLMASVGDGVLTLAEYDERAAVLWQARTRAELDALVADLPVPAAPAAAVPESRPQRVVAVMSEERFTGAVAPGQAVRGYAVMGSAVLDLRRDDLPDGVRVRVRSVMGDVTVRLPADVRVELSGVSVMGERSVPATTGDGPVVHLDAVAVMGSVHVELSDEVRAGGAAVTSSRRPAARSHGVGGGLHRRWASRLKGIGVGGVLALAAVGVVASGSDERVVFGSGVETVRADDPSVEVSMLFGSITVVVPDDAVVDTRGFRAFGSLDCETACDSDTGGRPPVRVDVRAIGAFGSVEVVTESEAAEDD